MIREIKKIERVHIVLIAVGFAFLLVGTLVYLTDRPPESTYFVNRSPVPVHFTNTFPHLFCAIGFYFPSFVHVLSFSLMTAGILACGKTGGLAVCLGWFTIDGLFELGQRYGSSAAAYVPGWFKGIPFLENTANYFRLGTFDPLDIVAAAAGALAAYLVILTLDGLAKSQDVESKTNRSNQWKGTTP